MQKKTPIEEITGKRPNLAHIGRVECKAYVHVQKQKSKGKSERGAIVGYLVGFAIRKSYKIYIPEKKTIVISRDAILDERQMLAATMLIMHL